MPGFEDPLSSSRMLSSSVSSVSSSRQASNIAKSYRQAAQLFLTRRLPEALSTIEPIIAPQSPAESPNGVQNGTHVEPAPIASASRGTRIKVWSFYLTFLNAVVELGPEEGKHAFGSTKWKALVNKTRDGSIWEEVVRDGYHNSEGDVDADVVIGLATLLLTHSPNQKLNQSRLETYLSATANPSFDIASHMEASLTRRHSNNNGTSTPRDLQTRLKLLELYTLHVLPRNEEWEYSREFIMMSEILDDERKEAFLQALYGLKEEKLNAAVREAELQKQQQEQLEQRQKEDEARRREAIRAEDERRKKEEDVRRQPRPTSSSNTNPSDPLNKRLASPPNRHTGSGPTTSSRPSRTPAKRPQEPPPNLYRRFTHLFAFFQLTIANMGQSVSSNPMAALRMMLFLLAFILAFARRDLRERVQRILRQAWEKVRRTAGMGVKVSYI
ncbi:hypothetical protein K402DRAFT_409850 [Aulographum hederae CBS 113979]|uniref:Peroxin 26 n=1 Tax=Aulographum hederae CBS 113979 TaxID=1176131 RepID=A0A6G1HD53_9PEZI|nr:hypothetical protein K402DRAFT_409850 [Aulographum hederae CBS 113979]